MNGRGGYVPPAYIPLDHHHHHQHQPIPEPQTLIPTIDPDPDVPLQWSSGICACCDDMPSCCVGLFCPCYLFAKNAQVLGSKTLVGPCITHFMLWALVNAACCLLTDGVLWGLPGCFIGCYAYTYRNNLRTTYNLQEAPCGDFATHFFCHQCAVCQEYREIHERSEDPKYAHLKLLEVTPPAAQKMDHGAEDISRL